MRVHVGLDPPSCSAMADANDNPQADASGTSESADMGTNGKPTSLGRTSIYNVRARKDGADAY